ncbi:MAG: hypothetical protein AVDCRST_MAG50-702, partial [uncultured Acidimicrobiales bacterium]
VPADPAGTRRPQPRLPVPVDRHARSDLRAGQPRRGRGWRGRRHLDPPVPGRRVRAPGERRRPAPPRRSCGALRGGALRARDRRRRRRWHHRPGPQRRPPVSRRPWLEV